MSGGGDASFVLTPEEQERITADVAEMQREADEWIAWLRSPEGEAWTAQQIQEAAAIAEEFKQECASGKYALSPAELEQLRRDGIFVSHRKKGGSGHD